MYSLNQWLKASNRYKHLGLGILVGTMADTWYCTEYAAVGVGGALELKDKLYGGKWDWIDFALTVVGFNLGYLLRIGVLRIVS